jgi:hypothetical protein
MRSICDRKEDVERTHRPATSRFLRYVEDLGRSTDLFLQDLVLAVPDPAMATVDRQSLPTIRDFWRDIHEFVKPSRDADTLHSPVALVEQLEDRLSLIPALRGCKLLICHTPELNYIQFPRSSRRIRAEHYAAIVPGSPQFPDKLALIAMPYSQDESLFSNIIICHEMGHFVFEELKLEDDLSAHIEASLQKHFPQSLNQIFPGVANGYGTGPKRYIATDLRLHLSDRPIRFPILSSLTSSE